MARQSLFVNMVLFTTVHVVLVISLIPECGALLFLELVFRVYLVTESQAIKGMKTWSFVGKTTCLFSASQT